MNGPLDSLPLFEPDLWTADAVVVQFPDLVDIGVAKALDLAYLNPRGRSSFRDWWDLESNCWLYAICDRTLASNRLVSSSNLPNFLGIHLSEEQIDSGCISKLLVQSRLTSMGDRLEWDDHTRPIAAFVRPDEGGYHFLRLDRLPDSQTVWTGKLRNKSPRIVKRANGDEVMHPREADIWGHEYIGCWNVPLDLDMPNRPALGQYLENDSLLPREKAEIFRCGTLRVRQHLRLSYP